MTDRTDILRAILAEPAEDLHRLVYADFLEEAGETDRAEFIRVQCELAQHPDEVRVLHLENDVIGSNWLELGYRQMRWKDTPCTKKQWKLLLRVNDLRYRETILLDQHYQTWGRELPGTFTVEAYSGTEYWIHLMDRTAWTGRVSVRFRRGFIEEIECTSMDWKQCSDSILERCPIQTVRLTTWPGKEFPTGQWCFPSAWYPSGPAGIVCHSSECKDVLRRGCREKWPGITFELPPEPVLAWQPNFFIGIANTGDLPDPRIEWFGLNSPES